MANITTEALPMSAMPDLNKLPLCSQAVSKRKVIPGLFLTYDYDLIRTATINLGEQIIGVRRNYIFLNMFA